VRCAEGRRTVVLPRGLCAARKKPTEAYKEEDVKYYKWVAIKDWRTCPMCKGLDGGIIGLTIPSYMDPPVHTNCRCFTIPYELTDVEKRLYEKIQNGKVGIGENAKPYTGTRNPAVDFTNKAGNSTLTKHFSDHKANFDYKTEQQYLSGARNFLEKSTTSTTQSFVSDGGTYFRYDTTTNEFGIVNEFGGISTYFKPDTGMDYWLDQISRYAPK